MTWHGCCLLDNFRCSGQDWVLFNSTWITANLFEKENVEKWYNNNAMCEMMMMKRMIYITGVVDASVRIEYSSIQHG